MEIRQKLKTVENKIIQWTASNALRYKKKNNGLLCLIWASFRHYIQIIDVFTRKNPIYPIHLTSYVYICPPVISDAVEEAIAVMHHGSHSPHNRSVAHQTG